LPAVSMSDDGPQQVAGNQEVPATIVDATLAEHVGSSVFTAVYGAGPLIAVQEVAAAGTQHVIGPVELDDGDAFTPATKHVGPLVMSYKPAPGSGTLVFTTFHNDEQADEVMLGILYYLVFLL